ncbi:uncharacterized protein isoform X1 [Rhodnius prolixus]|uniref:uncharacterized protein isoform X1 n=1 Tax=Rhodnius prolixus TaxID=13249 RepID=UPI003D18B179
MERYTAKERAFCVEAYFRDKSVVKVHRAFRKQLKVKSNESVPTRKSILRWVENFRESGKTTDKIHPGAKRTVRTPENIGKVCQAIKISPTRSARRHAASLKLSRESVRRILTSDLNHHPYKLMITQELKETDYRQRLLFAENLLKKLDDGEIDLNNLLMSDEAHFELSGLVNKQNFGYWASGNPQFIPEKPSHGQRVTVWAGVASWGIIGPYFFDGTVNGERYGEMLNLFLIPQLRRKRRLNRTWFQQDGATCHTAALTLALLKETFGIRLLSRSSDFAWPPCSPDLTVPDFFLCGYLKSRVYETKPRDLEDLKSRIRAEFVKISASMLKKVFKNFVKRLEECKAQNGHHLKDVISHK